MMKKRVFLSFILIVSCLILSAYSNDRKKSTNKIYDVNDPKENSYSVEQEQYLKSRNYKKIEYELFSSTEAFDEACQRIYKESYGEKIPNKIAYYTLSDGLHYCMLSNGNKNDDPPIVVFLISSDKNCKYVFYKINENLTYEIIEKPYYDATDNFELKKRAVKIFY